MRYEVWSAPAAKRAMARLPRNLRARIDSAIQSLGDNPRPSGCVKLGGTPNGWRVRVGDWRILYAIEDDRLIVLVVDVGHRREIYRKL